MRLMRREYMKMLFNDENVSENDNGSEYGEESSTTRTLQTESLICGSTSAIEDPAEKSTNKRLKEVTAKHILENFKKIGKQGPRNRYSHRRSTSQSDGDEEESDYSSSQRSMSYRYGTQEDANWVIGADMIG